MKILACSNYSNKACVDLERSLAEKEDFELCITAMGNCLAEAIAELIKQTCETISQGEVLTDVILERVQLQVENYIEQDLAKDLERKQEATLYEYMREVFYRWLHGSSVNLPIERWKVKYRGSCTLKMEPVLLADTGMLAVLLTNEKVGDLLVELDPKNRGTEAFNRALSEAYIIATVAGDIIFGEESNPIRKLPVGENADGGLSEAIDHLLSNQQEGDGNGF